MDGSRCTATAPGFLPFLHNLEYSTEVVPIDVIFSDKPTFLSSFHLLLLFRRELREVRVPCFYQLFDEFVSKALIFFLNFAAHYTVPVSSLGPFL